MITKQELNDRVENMNESLKKKDEKILKMEIEIENLKYKLKSKKGLDADIEKIREKDIENLKYNISILKDDKKYLSETVQKLNDELNFYKSKVETKNIRGAGRKSKATLEQIETIQKLNSEGLSYGKIAKEVGLSVGTVFNIVNHK